MILGCILWVTACRPVVETAAYRVPVGAAEPVRVLLRPAVERVVVNAESAALFAADVESFGRSHFTHSDDRIELRSYRVGEPPRPLTWTVGLHPAARLDLDIDSAASHVEMNGGTLNLASLTLHLAAGNLIGTLPAPPHRYPVTITSAAGDVTLNFRDGAHSDIRAITLENGGLILNLGSGGDITLGTVAVTGGDLHLIIGAATRVSGTLSAMTGEIYINTPAGSAARLDVRHNPAGAVLAEGDLRLRAGSLRAGVWQTSDVHETPPQIDLVIAESTVGNVQVRRGD